MDDSAFREKLDGIDNRDKFRIRIYNMSDAAIKLECKHKEGGYIKKTSLALSREEYERLRKGIIPSCCTGRSRLRGACLRSLQQSR